MAVAPPANPRDVQDFQFKLLCRLRIFTAQDGTFTKAVNLVAPASKYGLVFVGCPAGVQVILSSSIIGFQHPSSGSGGEISTYPRREIPLSSQPSHLSVSCDQNYLVVAVKKDSCDHAYIYSVPSFVAKDIILVSEVRLSTKSDTYVLELTWNPGIPNILAACLSDGSMATYELKTSGVDLNTLPPATQATCFCWSPKGKQLVVGSETGTLTQYKPDLKPVKTFPAPSLGSGSVAVVNVVWLSNYQFAAVYRDKVNIDERPGLLIVNAPKAGAVSFVNYEDICYSAGDLRLSQFYLIHQPTWNILMVASANGMEVGVLGLQEDQISWEQWTQEDAGRAELPLSVDKQETFPIGFGLDTSTQHELPWGENQSLPPMPVLHILSHQGVLCLFYAVNLRQNAACICLPPEKLPDESGLAMFTTVSAQLHMAGEMSEQPSDSAVNAGLGNIRVNLTQKFESISTSQGNSGLFSFGTGLSGTSPGLTSATSSSFVTLPASMTPSTVAFGACLTSTKSTDFITKSSGSHGAEHTSVSSTMFGGAPSTGFSTGLGGALPTGVSIPSTELSNPAITNFGTGLSTPSSTFNIGFANPAPIHSSAGANTQSFVSSGLGFSNSASVGVGNNPALTGSSVPTSKPTFGFLSTLSATPDSPNLKQGPTQTSNFSFSGPGVPSTPIGEEKSTTQQLQSQVTTKSQTGSVTITKVQPAGTAQMAKVDKPVSDAKLPNETKHPAATLPSTLAINTSVFYQAIAEEVTHFERELSGLRSRVNGITIQVGSEDEKRMLHKKLDKIEEFWRELKETTQAQSQEIHSLKSVFMEAFAWVAEAKSRAQHLNSPMYLQVARSQALDPVSAQYAANIKHLVYYVENQLRQINEQLDNSWLDFQDSCKPTVKCKIHIPTLEAVYQAMVMHNNILNKQRAIMADVARRAQEQGSRTQIPLISSAVLARVRDKEASQLGKGETELSRLAENLVQMKLGPSELQNSYGMGLHYHRLTRKKESVLRHLLSQSTVTHVCPTKPQRSVVGGISTGKPVITMTDASLYAVGRKKTIGLTLGTSTESISSSGIDNVTKSESVQAPLSLFGPTQPTTSLDASNKNNSSRNFPALGMKYVVPNKGLTTTTPAADGIFVSTLDSSKAKPISSDNTVLSKANSQTAANIFTGSKTAIPGEFTFNYALENGRNSTLSNFSYGMGLNKIPSVAKLNNASKRLEDYYEELTPPGSPRHSPKETIPAKGNPATNTFAFNFTLTPITTSSVTTESFTSQTSPLMSLGSIVAGIGDGTTVSRITTKQASDKAVATLPSNTMGGSSFSFGSSSVSHSQQGGSILSKPEDQKHSSETFRFSLPGSSFTTISTTSQPVCSNSSISQVTPPKVSTPPTTSMNSQTPFLTSFSMENRQSSTPTQIGSIFGGSDNQTFSAFSGSGSNPVSSGSGNIFAQTVIPAFGGSTPVSPSKQPASSGNVFGTVKTAPTSTNSALDKQGSDSDVCTELGDSHQHKSESPSKNQCPVVTTSSTDSFFSQSATLFGSLSVGAGTSPKPTSAGNIFGSESSVPTPANFIFGKQITTTDAKNITSVAAETPPLDSAESDKQQSESSSKDIQPTPIKPVSTSSFNAPVTETTPVKPDSSGGTENKEVLNSPLLFGSGKPENTTSTPVTFSFSQLGSSSSSASTTQSSIIFGQTPTTEKPMTGSLFGLTSTSVTTTSPTSVSATSAETETTSTANTTFSFALPVSTSSSTPFTQKSTLFGLPVSSAAPTTTSNSSFFGQSVCSPAAFGQSGGNIFGQSSTGAKTNIFGQTAATTSAPPVFGQTVATTSSPPVFGQTAATTSAPSVFGQTPTSTSIFGQSSSPPSLFGQTSSSAPFLGGSSTGGFGSKSVFGQSGGSIFGQSGSSGFGASGSSVFGGGSSSIFGGGSTSPSTGNLFQSSTGGSIFGGSSSPTSGTPGAFSSGLGQSISQSGFGSTTAFQSKTGAFGGSPVFERGTSGFGASPTFGGAPTFGGSPRFGSPAKVFGSTSPAASVGFGTAGQQSSTFETLATQNTMTFGNLAQNQGQGFGSPTQSIFGGTPPNTQSTNTSAFSGGSGTFGGSSFSNWR